MVLRPNRMVRIRIIGSNSMRESIVYTIHNYGMMQIEQVDPELSKEIGSQKPSRKLEEMNRLLQTFRSYESLLPPLKVKEKRKFDDEDQLLKEAESISIGKELRVLKRREEDILTDVRDIENRIDTVKPISGVNYDMSIYNSSMIKSYVAGPGEQISYAVKEELRDSVVIALSSGEFVITIRREEDRDLARIATNGKFTLRHIPETAGKPAEYLASLERVLGEKKESLESVRDQLLTMSQSYYAKIAQIREQLEIQVSGLDLAEKLPRSEGAFALEGWIASRNLERLSRALDIVSGNRVVISTVQTDEEPPTVLSNPIRMRFFEFFIRFYSLPKESEYDPTLIFALVFPVFFALMVGDWGYGLTILLIAVWLKRRIEHPPKVSRLPKKLTGFVTRIFGPGPLLILAKTLIPSGILAMAVGMYFDNFFGFHVLTAIFGYHRYEVMTNVPKLLLLSGYIGIGMVSFGLVLSILDNLSLGRKKHAAGKGGWLLFAVGIVILGLNVLHKSFVLGTSSPSSLLSVGMVLAGIVIIIATEGGQSAIELTTMISHILSYTRIVGVLLASVVMAYILDIPFASGLPSSASAVAIGIAILVLGQLFNLVIAVFEPGIQGARLIYVEFFSKFYHGGGKSFKPFKVRRKYTIGPDGIETGK